MKFILLIAWSAGGTGYTLQEFNSRATCEQAAAWVRGNDWSSANKGLVRTECLPKGVEPK